MSELEDFLSRWVQRKHEAAEAAKSAESAKGADSAKGVETPRSVPDDAAPETIAPPVDASASPAPAPAVDLSALPPIESIIATTDITGYLAPGVPAELTRAALRRAWLADPQVRNFVGIAENQWDFTDPNSIPGFGTFGPLDDVSRLVARVIQFEDSVAAPADADAPTPRHVTETPDSSTPEMVADATASEIASGEIGQPMPAVGEDSDVRCSESSDAAHNKPDAGSSAGVSGRRHHGGALPK